MLGNSFKYAKNKYDFEIIAISVLKEHSQITPKTWNYSSFDKFVQNGFYEQDWCNFEDKYKISTLDYE